MESQAFLTWLTRTHSRLCPPVQRPERRRKIESPRPKRADTTELMDKTHVKGRQRRMITDGWSDEDSVAFIWTYRR